MQPCNAAPPLARRRPSDTEQRGWRAAVATTGTPFPNLSVPARDLIFISYSHRDRDWLEHLRVFLKPYTRQNLQIWADPYIEVGGQWRRDITAALLRSCVGVLLLSPDFLASDFIHSEELPPLLEGAEDGSIILLVIPISASNYEMSPLAKYRFAHSPDRPLDRMRKAQRNAALVEITKKIVASAGHRRSRLAWCSGENGARSAGGNLGRVSGGARENPRRRQQGRRHRVGNAGGPGGTVCAC